MQLDLIDLLPASRVCVRCGVDIGHRDKRSRHCSPLCRDRDRAGSVIGTVRDCRFCGRPFAPSKNPHVYCSATCRSRADVEQNRAEYNRRNAERRARERGARTVERFTRKQVFDRDGWICQLCLAPIDWRLTGRHPLAASLDHIIPLSRGGLHTLANTQAAHFSCNARKSAHDVPPLLPPPKRR